MKKSFYIVTNWFYKNYIIFSLFLATLAVVGYALFSYQQISQRGFFEYIGIDFRLFYASGQIIRDYGFDAVYDVNLQTQYQLPLYDGYSRYKDGLSLPFWALQIPYIPFFLVIFIIPSYFSPLGAFLGWVIFNITFTIIYLYIWVKRLADKSKNRTELFLVIIIFLSIQNFLNTIMGQVNLILMVSIGESLFNLMRGKYFNAGLWLTLGWIKPQMVLLLCLVSLIQRNWHYIVGFLSGSLIIGAVSIALGGWKGIEGVFSTLRNWPTILRSSGITWLSAVDHLVMQGISTTLAYILGITLVLVVFIAYIRIIQKFYIISKNSFTKPVENILWSEMFLATLATQSIVMPHGNVHMTLALAVPWLVYLYLTQDRLGWYIFINWSLISGIIFVLIALKSVGQAHNLLGMLILLAHLMTVSYFYNRQISRNLKY